MDLKPCPFCGSDAELIDAPEPMNEGCVVVECTKCHASTCVSYAVKDDPRPVVIDAWNRRHEDAELARLRAELAREAEAVALLHGEREQHQSEMETTLAREAALRWELERSKGLLAGIAGHIAIRHGMSPVYAAEVRRQIDAFFLSQNAVLSAPSPGLEQVRREAKAEVYDKIAAETQESCQDCLGRGWYHVGGSAEQYPCGCGSGWRRRAAELRKGGK